MSYASGGVPTSGLAAESAYGADDGCDEAEDPPQVRFCFLKSSSCASHFAASASCVASVDERRVSQRLRRLVGQLSSAKRLDPDFSFVERALSGTSRFVELFLEPVD
jgi:hypothetical protein